MSTMDSWTYSASTLAHQLLSRDTGYLDCTTQYSGDYYGFGVRMGVYFSWLSSYLANICLPSEVSGALDTNSFFLLALLISLFRGSVTGDLVQVDGLISMHLSSGFIFSSLSIWGYRSLNYANEGPKAIHYFGGFGTHCRLVLITAISIYGTWFWWDGVNGGLEASDHEGCRQVWTWFFHTWPTTGGIHILYIIMTVSCSLYFSSMCFVAVACIGYRLLSFRKRRTIRFETGYNHAELTFLFKFFRVFSISWIIFCMVMIELTLHKNRMYNTFPNSENVGSPAQLIPLLIGILSFVRVLFLLYVETTGRFGDIWRFELSDEGQHGQQQTRVRVPMKLFGINLRGLMGPAMPTRRANTQDFEQGMEIRADAHRPLWKRYLVGLLPWLSVFELWRHVSPEDVETAAVREKVVASQQERGGHEIKDEKVKQSARMSLSSRTS